MNFMGLSLAANTMSLNQKAMDIISQNIANSQTEGYSRQEAAIELQTFGYSTTKAELGTYYLGSTISEVTRYRDDILDNSVRRESSYLGEMEAKADYLQEAADIFDDESDFGLSVSLNEFWQSWNSAATNPENSALREMVISQGSFLAQSIRQKASKLDELATRIDKDLNQTVTEINSLLDELAVINDEIVKSTADTFETNVMLDRKDLLLDELSGYMNIEVDKSVKDSISIYVNGSPLLIGKQAYHISMGYDADDNIVINSGLGREIENMGGKVQGMIESLEEYVQGYQGDLDSWAQALIDGVNQIHQYGYGIDGTTNLDFFSGDSASTINVNFSNPDYLALSVPTLSSTSNINEDDTIFLESEALNTQLDTLLIDPDANGSFEINGTTITWDDTMSLQDILEDITDQTGISWSFDSTAQTITLSAPTDSSTITITDLTGNFTQFTNLNGAGLVTGTSGDGTNGIRMFEVSQQKVFGNPDPIETFNERYQTIVSNVGYDTNLHMSASETQNDYVDSLTSKRESVSGVSIDEEVINLVKYQRAYQAGAKLASLLDEMLETLINIT